MHSSTQNSMPSNHTGISSAFKENFNGTSNALLDAISAYTDKRKKPKRNRSAFILFSVEKRKEVKDKEIASLNPNDKFVKIAELWKGLSKEEKKVYEDKAKQEKNRYANELNDYSKIFPAEPIQRPRNHIKKPCNAYGYYLKDIKDDIRAEFPALRMCEVLKIVGERWKNLDSKSKTIYEQRAEADRQNFKIQMSKQSLPVIKSSSTKSVAPSIKEEDELDLKSPSTQKQVKFNEGASEMKAFKSTDHKVSEILSSRKISVSSLSPVHEQENVRENINKTPIILQSSVPTGELPTRKSSFSSSINNAYATPNTNSTLTNFVSSPIQQESSTLNNSAKFLGLLDMYLKVDLLRQNIFMQLQSMAANNDQLLTFNHTDQINNPVLNQLDPTNALELLAKFSQMSAGNDKVKREELYRH